MKDDKEKKDLNDNKRTKKFKKTFKQNKDEERKSSKVCMNDPSWYVLNPELLKDAASLPFSHFLGRGFDLASAAGNRPKEGIIVKMPYLYTLGVASGSGDPVNLAIRNLYTYVRHQNSGHTNYESADLGLYLLSVSTVVATLAHLERCVGVAKCFERRSAIMPFAVLAALGVTNNTFRSNLANYTVRLNVMWQRVSSLCIPTDFSFLKRWIWMNSQIFKDHESDKAALYIFKPIGVPLFNKFTLDAGSISQPTSESLTPTIDDWFNDCETALDAILNDEDMNIMSGDILKAYGEENLLKFGMTPIDYVLKPVYVEEMLPQIEHAQTPLGTITSSGVVVDSIATGINYDIAQAINDQTNSIYTAASDSDYFTIYQVNGEIVCTPVPRQPSRTSPIITTATGVLGWHGLTSGLTDIEINNQRRILNAHKEVVPPEDIMIATRLMYVTENDTRNSTGFLQYKSCGSELLTKFVIYYCESFGNLNVMGYDAASFYSGDPSNYKHFVDIENVISQFDWRPITYLSKVIPGATPVYGANAYVFGDVDNFTLIAPETLDGLHLTALLAEFSVTKYNLIK